MTTITEDIQSFKDDVVRLNVFVNAPNGEETYTTSEGESVETIPHLMGNLQINTISANYTLVLSDSGKTIDSTSATGINLTVPSDASVNFSVGTVIPITQIGTGQVTLVAAGGVTINTISTLKTAAQYAVILIRKLSANTWLAVGQLAYS